MQKGRYAAQDRIQKYRRRADHPPRMNIGMPFVEQGERKKTKKEDQQEDSDGENVQGTFIDTVVPQDIKTQPEN